MKHSSIRELFTYWNERRAERPVPERGDIEPGAIRRVLADTFILAFEGPADHPFRIAGTRVCAAFGRELKGEAFVGLWSTDSRPLVRDLLTVVSHETIGAVAAARGVSAEGSELDFELLVLPLSHRGRTDVRIIGALAPADVPYWFGTSAVTGLTLGTIRYLSPATLPTAQPPQPVLPRGRLRQGLVVYDGGQV